MLLEQNEAPLHFGVNITTIRETISALSDKYEDKLVSVTLEINCKDDLRIEQLSLNCNLIRVCTCLFII